MTQAQMTPDEVSEQVRNSVAELNEAARPIDPETTDPADLDRLIQEQEQAVNDAADTVAILGNQHRTGLIRETARLAELKAVQRAVLARQEKERDAQRESLRDRYLDLCAKASDATTTEAADRIVEEMLRPAVDSFIAALDGLDEAFKARDAARSQLSPLARQLGEKPPQHAAPDIFQRQIVRALAKHIQQIAGSRQRMARVFELFPNEKVLF